MDIALLMRWTGRWEGRRPVAYDDATGETIRPGVKIIGNPTIGQGANLLTAAARAAILAMGLDYSQVLTGAVTLTDAQIDELAAGGLNTAVSDARELFPGFDTFPEHAQIALGDLSFNMGRPRLSEFHQMLACIAAKNWPGAAAQLKDSAWFHQVGAARNQRGGADVAVLGGADPEDILNA